MVLITNKSYIYNTIVCNFEYYYIWIWMTPFAKFRDLR